MFVRSPSSHRSKQPRRLLRESDARQRRLLVEQLEDRSLLAVATLIHPDLYAHFGEHVVPLPNGNVVVTASRTGQVPNEEAGAVYLFNGETGEVISTLRGHTKELIGSGGIIPLPTGDFLIVSPFYGRSGSSLGMGAVTWASGVTGINGYVDETNSLVGSVIGDQVGSDDWYSESLVKVLPNGDYVVLSPNWNDGAGAITLGDGQAGTVGVVSAENSLIGVNNGRDEGLRDDLDVDDITVLTNGNAVVLTYNAAVFIAADGELHGTVGPHNSLMGGMREVLEVGDSNYVVVSSLSVTWADGDTGINGVVSSSISLRSSWYSPISVTVLKNGDYVVTAPTQTISGAGFNGEAQGAVTWADGNVGIAGEISATNSLVGKLPGDNLGSGGIVALENGGYVVLSPAADTATMQDVGAVTWAPAGGLRGTISPANSLYGGQANDRVGSGGVVELANGNYVVRSPLWDFNDVEDVGAVTWARGGQAVTGVVTTLNSLVGASENDQIGATGITALANGNYLIASESWDNGLVANAGAVTWGNGATGTSGVVSPANSLVGSSAEDRIGTSITELANGNYLVASESWDNGLVANAGAVTWGNGATGTSGVVSPANSLVGSTTEDRVGTSITELTNGNYVVLSPHWSNAGVAEAGAMTWQRGTVATGSVVSATNSFVGTQTGDFSASVAGSQPAVVPLTNGNFVFATPGWNSGSFLDVGAVTWHRGNFPESGSVTQLNSLFGLSEHAQVGRKVIALNNGHYVVYSPWQVGRGAVTWGNGVAGTQGPVSSANSAVGAHDYDGIAETTLHPLPNGDYVFGSLAKSASWAKGDAPITGTLTAPSANHFVNIVPYYPSSPSFVFDDNRQQFFVRFGAQAVIPIGDYDTGLRAPKPQMKLSITNNLTLTAGASASVPVKIQTLVGVETAAGLVTNQLTSARLMIYFDPHVLQILNITRGNVLANAAGLWSVSSEINELAGYAAIDITGSEPIVGEIVGNLVNLNLQVKPEANPGTTTLNLASGRQAAHVTQLNDGDAQIQPQPTSAAHDAGVDGLITILAGAQSVPFDVPAAMQQGNNLFVTGTQRTDFIFIFALDQNRIRVRVNGQRFAEFVSPVQIQVNGRGGSDFVYIDPILRDPPPIISSGGEAIESAADAEERELALLELLHEQAA